MRKKYIVDSISKFQFMYAFLNSSLCIYFVLCMFQPCIIRIEDVINTSDTLYIVLEV